MLCNEATADQVQNPIVLVAHSMGGLVAKKASGRGHLSGYLPR